MNWSAFRLSAVLTAAALLPCQLAAQRQRLDLNGLWEFRLDAANAGERFTDSIRVPGSWQAQGFGQASGSLRHHYAGVAWYRRKIAAPASWRDRKIMLHVGGAHRRTTVFVNGVELGGHDGFSAPFSFDVSSAIRPGADNVIVLRIENPPVVIDASPDKQVPVLPTGMLNYIGNWGGIFGAVELESMPRTHVESVLITSDVERRRISFRVRVEQSAKPGPARLRVNVPGAGAREVAVSATGTETTVEVAALGTPLWSPEEPRLLTATVQLFQGGREIDRIEQRFGFRQVSTRGSTLLLNGKPLYLRGYGDDDVEVLTGFPPSSRAIFLERLKLARSFGFNAVRFHSMTPPPEYFEAADEAGMLVMAELPAAYTQYFFAHREFLKRELEGVLMAHRNHPSLLSLAFGNEFNLNWLKTAADRSAFLESVAEFYKAAKELAPETLIMSNDGFDMRPTDMVSLGRGAPADMPTVRHEFGQYYCSLPDIGLIGRFTGVMAPDWLEAKKKWVAANSLEGIYPTYLRNSQRLQQLGHKFQIERVRADSHVTGYHYWLIVDFPGGTGEGDSWEEGWFDYFWRPKGVTPEEGREINSPVLLMLDAGVDNRTLWTGESKRVGVLVSNYGTAAIRNGRLSWELRDGSRRVAGADITGINAELGAVSKIGDVTLDAGALSAPKKLDFVLKLDTGQGRYQNRWTFWAYPRQQRASGAPIPVVAAAPLAALQKAYPWVRNDTAALTPESLLITDALDARALAHLHSGGRVWLMLRQTRGRRGVEYFPASGGAVGTIVRDHAALAGFPHEGFCDLQLYNLVNTAFPLPIDTWPSEIKPIVGGIRTTSEFLSKTKNLSRVAYAVEGKGGGGKLFITTLRIRENLDENHPEVMALADAFLRYAAGAAFDPKETIPETALAGLGAE